MSVSTDTQGMARAGNLKIAYESAGTGEPALIYIHGICADRSYFSPQLTYYADRRRVVSLDLRGHGDSSVPFEVTIDDFVTDVIAVADEAGLKSAVLVGHSMAGVVGLKVALARPQLVRGVAMIDGPVLFPEKVRQALTGLVPALAGERWLDAMFGYFSSRIFDPHDPVELKQRVLADVRRARPDFVRTFFASLFSSDYAAEIQGAPCPLLYIHSRTPSDVQRLRELRPDAMVGQVVGSGHYAMLTAAGQVNSMLDRFLEVVDQSPA